MQQLAAPAEEQGLAAAGAPSEERETIKTTTATTTTPYLGTFVIPPPPPPSPPRARPPAGPTTTTTTTPGSAVEPPRPIRSVPLLFVRAVLGERDREAGPLRALLGPAQWDQMVALYRDDFARRGLFTAPRERPPFEPDGGLGLDGVTRLLLPPDAAVPVDEAHRHYGALEEMAQRVPGYIFV